MCDVCRIRDAQNRIAALQGGGSAHEPTLKAKPKKELKAAKQPKQLKQQTKAKVQAALAPAKPRERMVAPQPRIETVATGSDLQIDEFGI